MGAAEAEERVQRPPWRTTYRLAMASQLQNSVGEELAHGRPEQELLQSAFRGETPYHCAPPRRWQGRASRRLGGRRLAWSLREMAAASGCPALVTATEVPPARRSTYLAHTGQNPRCQ